MQAEEVAKGKNKLLAQLKAKMKSMKAKWIGEKRQLEIRAQQAETAQAKTQESANKLARQPLKAKPAAKAKPVAKKAAKPVDGKVHHHLVLAELTDDKPHQSKTSPSAKVQQSLQLNELMGDKPSRDGSGEDLKGKRAGHFDLFSTKV